MSCIAVNGTPSHSYGVSLAIRDHTVLPTTRHKWTHHALIPARDDGARFTYPGEMEGWVDLSDLGDIQRWFTWWSPIKVLTQQGIELATFWSRVGRPNQYIHHQATYGTHGSDCSFHKFPNFLPISSSLVSCFITMHNALVFGLFSAPYRLNPAAGDERLSDGNKTQLERK